MRFYLFLLGLLICNFSFAQDFQITGRVLDETSNPLQSATIYTEIPSDSSLVSYTISEKNGEFLLKGVTDAAKLNLIISYNGYTPHQQVIEVRENIDLEDIQLSLMDNALDEVTLTASRAPITIKKDTLEFNAGSFNTRQDANLEELMKKLPGVEVDSDGNITVNGKPVSRILVNGKEFFGNDR